MRTANGRNQLDPEGYTGRLAGLTLPDHGRKMALACAILAQGLGGRFVPCCPTHPRPLGSRGGSKRSPGCGLDLILACGSLHWYRARGRGNKNPPPGHRWRPRASGPLQPISGKIVTSTLYNTTAHRRYTPKAMYPVAGHSFENTGYTTAHPRDSSSPQGAGVCILRSNFAKLFGWNLLRLRAGGWGVYPV